MRMPFDGVYPVTDDFMGHISAGGARATYAGTDWGLPIGTPLYAIESGYMRTATDQYGALFVVLSCFSGNSWEYVHLSGFNGGSRDVNEGELIGWSGNSGWTTGPHLHLALVQDGARIDPLSVLSPTPKSDYPVDTHVKFHEVTNIRTGPRLSEGIIYVGAVGSVGKVKPDIDNNHRFEADGYVWYNVWYPDVEGWMVDNHMEPTEANITTSDAYEYNREPTPEPKPDPVPEPEPVPDPECECTELNIQIDELVVQIDKQIIRIKTLETDKRDLQIKLENSSIEKVPMQQLVLEIINRLLNRK